MVIVVFLILVATAEFAFVICKQLFAVQSISDVSVV